MYKSITLLFPGQGAQHIGMGKELEGTPSFSLFEKADQILNYPISKICFDGPEEKLTQTQNTQPALLTHSIAIWERIKPILEKKNIPVDLVLGHSLGEYSAMVVAGALSFEDALKAVHLRGKFMQEAVPAGVGKMFAIMRTTEDMVVKACEYASDPDNIVSPANFNEPSQTVISGHAEACDRAAEWVTKNAEGRVRALELKVSAPFHSQLMKPAAFKLAQTFESFNFMDLKIPYIANIDAKKYDKGTPAEIVKKNLIDQVTGCVHWSKSAAQIPKDSLCLEIGTGRVLSGLMRKINRDVKVLAMEFEESFKELEELI